MSAKDVQEAKEIFLKELEQDEEKVLETWRRLIRPLKKINKFISKLKKLP